MDKKHLKKTSDDLLLIQSLGGVSTLANRLGYSVQRVYNWTTRGIPASVKLEHREVFLSENNSEKAA